MRSNYRSVSNTIQKLEKNIYCILSFTVVLSTGGWFWKVQIKPGELLFRSRASNQ